MLEVHIFLIVPSVPMMKVIPLDNFINNNRPGISDVLKNDNFSNNF